MGMWKSQLEEKTPSLSAGIAKLKITETGEVFDVSSDDLDWESYLSDSDRGMGNEFHHCATVAFDSEQGNYRVEVTWNIWEYPAGILNYTDTEIEDGELLQDFDAYFLPQDFCVPDENYDDYYSSAILSNTSFRRTFLESTEKIQALLHVEMPSYIQLPLNQDRLPTSKNADIQLHLLGLLYSNVITALETFLSDAFINTVLPDKASIRKFIESTPEFAERKLSLKELFTRVEQVDNEVKKYLSDNVVWHRLEKVKSMYKDTLGVDFPDDWKTFFKAINLRHDIIHRNGRLRNGERIKLNEKDVRELIEKVQKLVDYLDSQIVTILDVET